MSATLRVELEVLQAEVDALKRLQAELGALLDHACKEEL